MELAKLFAITPAVDAVQQSEWPMLVKEASVELLLPALRERVFTHGLGTNLPTEIDFLLTTAESLNRERNEIIVSEAVAAAKLLNGIGVKPVALKGLAYLLVGIYPDPASRYLHDIDFLVPENRFARATELLHKHGYVDDDSDPIAPLRHHGPMMRRPEAPPIELHHRVALAVCSRLLPVADVFNSATSLELRGAHFLIPCPTHLVNHLILHSQLHNAYRFRALPPLRDLYDLSVLVANQTIDWKSLVKRYRDHGEYLTVALHLKEAERVLGLALPFRPNLGIAGNLRWARRRIISFWPWLRFIDPVHILMASFRNRLRMIPRVIEHPEHIGLLVRAILSKKSYRDLFGL